MQFQNAQPINLHGFTVNEALAQFIIFYNDWIKSKKGIEICVIHGYGSKGNGGKIRSDLRKFLTEHNDKLTWFPGEQIDNNTGVTYVKGYQKLPQIHEKLANKVIHFCQTPKTKDKIAGNFRKYGDQCVLKTIQLLEKNNQLGTVWKGKHKCYQAMERSLSK